MDEFPPERPERDRSRVAGVLITLSLALGLGVMAIDEEPPWYIYPLLVGMWSLATVWWLQVPARTLPKEQQPKDSWVPALVGALLASAFAAAWCSSQPAKTSPPCVVHQARDRAGQHG